jgi:alpha-1,6-mannosyltransferase
MGINLAIALLTFTAVVFRSEVLLLLGPLVFQYLFLRYISLSGVIKVGLVVGLVSLGVNP